MPTRKNDIAAINDKFRKDPMPNGKLLLTRGVADNGDDFARKAVQAVQDFKSFPTGNDPYIEHDFGAFELDGEKLFWKIDCYHRSMQFGSPDPPTRRSLSGCSRLCLPKSIDALPGLACAGPPFWPCPHAHGTAFEDAQYRRLIAAIPEPYEQLHLAPVSFQEAVNLLVAGSFVDYRAHERGTGAELDGGLCEHTDRLALRIPRVGSDREAVLEQIIRARPYHLINFTHDQPSDTQWKD